MIIPARDEERTIERTVRAFLAQTYPQLEIIVVNDRSTDGTGAILASMKGFVRVDGDEPPPGWLGKPWALHQGSERATGELLLFVDADVIYAPGAVEAAVAQLEAASMDMITLLPRFEMRGLWEHVAMPNLALFAFTFFPLWVARRSPRPWLALGGGSGILVREEAYRGAGGHVALQGAVVDDVGLARLLRRGGYRTEAVLADDFVSVRMYHGLREIVEGFTKNGFAVVGYNYFAAAASVILVFVGNLVPFALALTGNGGAILIVAVILLIRVVLYSALGYRIDNALLGHPAMVLIWLWIMVRSVWKTGIRRRVDWRGRRYDAGQTRFGA